MLYEYDQADLVRVMSPAAERTFLERGFPQKKLAVVPPVVDVEAFTAARFRGHSFTVCHVGRLEPLRGFHYLIKAYRAMSRPDTELVLWGGPSSRKVRVYLERQLAADRSIRVHPVSARACGYENVYSSASVFVHPSLADAYGYVVIEAMASGLPVIVTETTGAAELIRDGVNGYVVPPGNYEAIAERLRHLADNPSFLSAMGAAARAAASRLTQQAFTQCYVPRLQSLIC
jgi:glycosyltransferase involved in cell wall biosynthesis